MFRVDALLQLLHVIFCLGGNITVLPRDIEPQLSGETRMDTGQNENEKNCRHTVMSLASRVTCTDTEAASTQGRENTELEMKRDTKRVRKPSTTYGEQR